MSQSAPEQYVCIFYGKWGKRSSASSLGDGARFEGSRQRALKVGDQNNRWLLEGEMEVSSQIKSKRI